MYTRSRLSLFKGIKPTSLYSPKKAFSNDMQQQEPNIGSLYESLLNQSLVNCNFISQVVDYWAQNPNQLALRSIDQDNGEQCDVSYQELAIGSHQIANFLTHKKVNKGDTIALMLGQHVSWWYSLAGLMRQGIAVVPCPRLLTAKDLIYRINDLKINGMITSPEQQEKINSIRDLCPSLKTTITYGINSVQWDSLTDIFSYKVDIPKKPVINTTINDPCVYLYTSGTTGQPKAVIHHHDYPFFHWPTGKRWLKSTPNDLVYNASDTGWGFTLWITTSVWATGAKLLITPSNKKFNPQQMLKLLQEQPVTIFCAAPTVLRLLVAEKNFDNYSFPCLKRIVTVGEALDETVIQRFESRGIEVAVGFGQAETPLLMGRVDSQPHVSATMGKPISPYKVVILDENHQSLPPGNIGQIAVDIDKGTRNGIMQGYANAPEKTKNAFTSDGRYYLTGDWAEYRTDGFFAYQGRKDDLIKDRGYRIGPDEVEKAGMSHPAVAKIAIVGIPRELGSKSLTIKGFILLKPGYLESPELIKDIQEHIKQETAPYKYPRQVECLSVEEWSKYETISGKIRRLALREREIQNMEQIKLQSQAQISITM
ncbi:MAG: AMP-binding protein [Tatlockia sp.]|nr:AMP-binding protein [Tatlockia sp.]